MGGSSSSSKQSTSQTDNRRVLGQGALSAENSSIFQSSDSRQYDNSSTLTVTNTLDGGAINRAFDTADFSVGKSLGFAGDSLTKSIEFSGDTVDGAFSFGKNALSEVADSQTAGYDFSKNSARDAFSFARDAGAAAASSLSETSNLVKNAYADAKGRGAMTDNIMLAAIAMAGLVAFASVRK